MDKQEARSILLEELQQYRAKPYSELVAMFDAEPVVYERSGPAGTAYQIEIQAFWDDRECRNVRVMGSIDDGGWRAFCPLTEDFIKAADESCVGE